MSLQYHSQPPGGGVAKKKLKGLKLRIAKIRHAPPPQKPPPCALARVKSKQTQGKHVKLHFNALESVKPFIFR